MNFTLKPATNAWRWSHRLYAFVCGYWWLPCPLCSRHFGGHEEKGFIPLGMGSSMSICHACDSKMSAVDKKEMWQQHHKQCARGMRTPNQPTLKP